MFTPVFTPNVPLYVPYFPSPCPLVCPPCPFLCPLHMSPSDYLMFHPMVLCPFLSLLTMSHTISTPMSHPYIPFLYTPQYVHHIPPLHPLIKSPHVLWSPLLCPPILPPLSSNYVLYYVPMPHPIHLCSLYVPLMSSPYVSYLCPSMSPPISAPGKTWTVLLLSQEPHVTSQMRTNRPNQYWLPDYFNKVLNLLETMNWTLY